MPRRNGVPQVTTYASRAARAVFERLGFVVDRENSENQVRGVLVPNCEMHNDLTEDEDQLIVATHPSVPESDTAPTLSPRPGDAATTEPSDLSALRVKDLLQLQAAIVSELRGRGLVRTNSKSLGDIAEQIVLAREVPAADIEARTRYTPHINGRQPRLRQIESLGDDVTEEMRAAYAALDAVARA